MAFNTHIIIYILVYSAITVRSDCDCEFSDSLEFSGNTMEFLGLESESGIVNITTNHNNYNTNQNNNNNNPQQRKVDLHALVLDLARKNKKLTKKVANFPKIIERLFRNVAATKPPQLPPMMPNPYPQDKIIFVKSNNKVDSSESSSSESKSSSEVESVSSESNSSESKIKSERRRVTRRKRTKMKRKSASLDRATFSHQHPSQRSYNTQPRPSRKLPNYRVAPQDRHRPVNYRAASAHMMENNMNHLYHPKVDLDEEHVRIPRLSQRMDRSRGFSTREPNLWNHRHWSDYEHQTRDKIKFRHKDRKRNSGIFSSRSSPRTSRRKYSY